MPEMKLTTQYLKILAKTLLGPASEKLMHLPSRYLPA